MRRGITLIEVLVVLVICVLVIGLGFGLLVRLRAGAQRAECSEHLRRIGEAVHLYHDASSVDKALRTLPPSRIAPGYATWAVLLAPYLVKPEHPLISWDGELSYFAQKDAVREARVIPYFCPARRRPDTLSEAGDVDAAGTFFAGALGDYASVAGDGTPNHDWTGPDANGALIIAEVLQRKDDRIIKWKSRTSMSSLKRGDSFTLLIGERHVPEDHFGDAAFGDGSLYNGQIPADFSRVAGPGFPLAQSPAGPFKNNFGSYHSGICNFLYADGSCRPLANQTDPEILGTLANREE